MFSQSSRLSIVLAATAVAIGTAQSAIAQPASSNDFSTPADAVVANAKIATSKSTKSTISSRPSIKLKAVTANRKQSNRHVTDDATARGTAIFTAPDRSKAKYENYSAVNQLID